uniref:Uncharacterized protein n=1 Tax=Rhizophora mucronata TaxID=61149 RepID=A0A2P2NRT0_RHIMU
MLLCTSMAHIELSGLRKQFLEVVSDNNALL